MCSTDQQLAYMEVVAPRLGNLQRTEWRQRCRQALSDHLSKEIKLGIIVEPGQVRLIPDVGDEYLWTSLPEKEHLFTKQLSKHSIGAYMELCRGVGISFEAVAQSRTNTEAVQEVVKASSSNVSFTSKINDLEAENTRIRIELSHWREQAQADSATRQDMKGKFEQSQMDLCTAQTHIDQLRQQNVRLSLEVKQLKKRIGRRDKDVRKALSALQRSDKDPPFQSEDEGEEDVMRSTEHNGAVEGEPV